MTEDPLLTPAQTAELLGVSTGTLANWRSTQSEELSYVKIGSLIRYKKSQISDFIKRQTVGQ